MNAKNTFKTNNIRSC